MINSIEIFINSKEPKVQFDIYRGNNQVLMQFFKQKDILNWKNPFSIIDESGFVLLIHFQKNKTNNIVNLKRFKNNELFYQFKCFEGYQPDTYFYGVNSEVDVIQFYDLIINILRNIYNLNKSELNEIFYTVKAY